MMKAKVQMSIFVWEYLQFLHKEEVSVALRAVLGT